jgi:hypothetical protein
LAIRTKEATVTFDHPFSLTALEGQQPAGVYRLVMDEEEILGLSFLAFQRTATMLHIPVLPTSGAPRDASSQVILVDSAELTAALAEDPSLSTADQYIVPTFPRLL